MKCKNCESEFERTDEYINQKSWRTDPIFKWKLEYCDECTDKKVRDDLEENLSNVLNVLTDFEQNKNKKMNTYIVYTTSHDEWEITNGIYLVKANSKEEITIDFLGKYGKIYEQDVEIVSIETTDEILNGKTIERLQPLLIE